MSFAFFDCGSGIAGDMAVAALLDLGFPIEEIRPRIAALGVRGLEVAAEKTTRGGLAGTRYVVSAPAAHDHEHRGLAEVRALVARAQLPPAAERIALEAFRRLAEAEARLHATTPEKVHFHEVGAADALADVVGFALAYAGSGFVAGEAVASPLPFTRGRTNAAHGSLPLPAPATLALLEGFAVEASPVEGELVTPTGAALLATVAKPDATLGRARLGGVGHGAGTREIPGRPNLLRIARMERGNASSLETVDLVETNIDDSNPQVIANLADELRGDGALDVWMTPVIMKKGRSGVVLSMISREADTERLSSKMFLESTTIGARVTQVRRLVVEREIVPVATRYGEIRVKIARSGGFIQNIAPEFEDAKTAAKRAGVALKLVIAAALRAAEDKYYK